MTDDRDRLGKVLAIAISPGAYEGEAIAALRKARELVGKNPTLAYPPPQHELSPQPVAPNVYLYRNKITNISPFWLNILINGLSEDAYKLEMISKITCDFTHAPTAVDILCKGSKDACSEFHASVLWLVDYINSKPRNPTT